MKSSKKKQPLTLVVAESDSVRIVQVGPGRFVLEHAYVDASGGTGWHRRHDDPTIEEAVSLVRGTKGLIDVRASWQRAPLDWSLLVVGLGIGLAIGHGLWDATP